MYQFVRVRLILEALQWLKENNKHYSDVCIDKDFLDSYRKADPLLAQQLFTQDADPEPEVVGQGSSSSSDSEGEVDNKYEVIDAKTQLPSDPDAVRSSFFESTCVQPNSGPAPDTTGKMRVYSVAPAETGMPISVIRDEFMEELSQPSIFPTGVGGFFAPRKHRIQLGQYAESRLFSSDPRFSQEDYIFALQYRMDRTRITNSIRLSTTWKGKTKAKNGELITAGRLKNPEAVGQLIGQEKCFRFLSSIRGSPMYWGRVFSDVLAMVRTCGIPTWFVTYSSADTQWNENIHHIIQKSHGRTLSDDQIEEMSWAERCATLRGDPVTVARNWDYRFKTHMKEVVLNKDLNPLGDVTEHFYRVEFQQRGAAHCHCLYWVREAPTLDKNTDEEVCEFIDEYVSCAQPLPGIDPELGIDISELVQKLQTHNHKQTCYKKSKAQCRFHFPRDQCDTTFIERNEKEDSDEEDSEDCVKTKKTKQSTLQKVTVNLCRSIEELNINPYCPKILGTWRANIDVQFITNVYACAAYILSYVCKAEKELSATMKEAVAQLPDNCSAREYMFSAGNSFVHGRELGTIEAVYRASPSMQMRHQTRAVQWIPVGYPEERVRLLKKENRINHLADESEDVFEKNLLDRYSQRPDHLEDMCLQEFGTKFRMYYGPKQKTNMYDEATREIGSDCYSSESDEDQNEPPHPQK
ncbi:MAG: hypothetical protein GY795_37190 [Desulfobacterales bacterium]|nr:hypothetical protein [Desulfobacterales bacterium]